MEDILETRLNQHMQHIEDLVLFGKEGINEMLRHFQSMLKRATNETDSSVLSQKLDGAPAVQVAHNVAGYPAICVGIKSLLNNPKNAYASIDEINDKFGDKPELAKSLVYCLEIASQIPDGEVWQGDCLFTDSSKREETINGTDYVTFQPNKIIYAFSEENEGYNDVKSAKFGIAFHTIYKKSGDGWSQSFNIDTSNINVDGVYLLSPAVNTSKSKWNVGAIKQLFIQLQDAADECLQFNSYDDLTSNEVFMKYVSMFENANMSDKQKTTLSADTFIDDLSKFVGERRTNEYNKKISTLKTERGKEKATSQFNSDMEELSTIIKSNSDLLVQMVNTINAAAALKMRLLETLNSIEPGYSTYLQRKSTGEFIKTPGEGLALSDSDGNVVKLVDRSTFSNANRDPDFTSGFERRESLQEDVKPFVTCFGRMNPITIAHKSMIDFMSSLGVAKVFLSHSQDKEKNPLPYDRKLYWVEKACPGVTVESEAKNMYQALSELYQAGVKNVIYVCGSDRLAEAERIKTYNGKPDRKGNILFNFDSLEVRGFGDDRLEEALPISQVSASKARQCVKECDFEQFKQMVPFNEQDAYDLFEELRGIMLEEVQEQIVQNELLEANNQLTWTKDERIIATKMMQQLSVKFNEMSDESNEVISKCKHFLDWFYNSTEFKTKNDFINAFTSNDEFWNDDSNRSAVSKSTYDTPYFSVNALSNNSSTGVGFVRIMERCYRPYFTVVIEGSNRSAYMTDISHIDYFGHTSANKLNLEGEGVITLLGNLNGSNLQSSQAQLIGVEGSEKVTSANFSEHWKKHIDHEDEWLKSIRRIIVSTMNKKSFVVKHQIELFNQKGWSRESIDDFLEKVDENVKISDRLLSENLETLNALLQKGVDALNKRDLSYYASIGRRVRSTVIENIITTFVRGETEVDYNDTTDHGHDLGDCTYKNIMIDVKATLKPGSKTSGSKLMSLQKFTDLIEQNDDFAMMFFDVCFIDGEFKGTLYSLYDSALLDSYKVTSSWGSAGSLGHLKGAIHYSGSDYVTTNADIESINKVFKSLYNSSFDYVDMYKKRYS